MSSCRAHRDASKINKSSMSNTNDKQFSSVLSTARNLVLGNEMLFYSPLAMLRHPHSRTYLENTPRKFITKPQ